MKFDSLEHTQKIRPKVENTTTNISVILIEAAEPANLGSQFQLRLRKIKEPSFNVPLTCDLGTALKFKFRISVAALAQLSRANSKYPAMASMSDSRAKKISS